MPIKIADQLPARHELEKENVFVMSEDRALHQDIRPLKIIILNLMPKKLETETQLLRLLSNSPLQIEVDLLQTATYHAKHTSAQHMLTFYKVFDDIKNENFDGMIVTGAPVEHMKFEDVAYWDELCKIFDWAETHVSSTLFICWGAQAGLYHYYGIPKHDLSKKMFGVFPHWPLDLTHPLLRGFDDIYYVPHSRHTGVRCSDIAKCKDLQILSYSDMAGVHIVSDMECRKFFVTGHSEYDRMTLANEYFRDKDKGLEIDLPYNYFPNDDVTKSPPMKWRTTASLLFSNWLNYFVYQKTPYDISGTGNFY